MPKEELESESAPLPVGPIASWQEAIITKFDLMLSEISRDGTNCTIIQRSKHYTVSRMFLREKPVSVKFMVVVTDPRNESTSEIIKVSHSITETTPLTHLVRAPLELVPRTCWSEHSVGIETDQAICVANASTREEAVDCRDR